MQLNFARMDLDAACLYEYNTNTEHNSESSTGTQNMHVVFPPIHLQRARSLEYPVRVASQHEAQHLLPHIPIFFARLEVSHSPGHANRISLILRVMVLPWAGLATWQRSMATLPPITDCFQHHSKEFL